VANTVFMILCKISYGIQKAFAGRMRPACQCLDQAELDDCLSVVTFKRYICGVSLLFYFGIVLHNLHIQEFDIVKTTVLSCQLIINCIK